MCVPFHFPSLGPRKVLCPNANLFARVLHQSRIRKAFIVTSFSCKKILFWMGCELVILQLCRSTVGTLLSAQSCGVSLMISCVHLDHSSNAFALAQVLFCYPKIIVRVSFLGPIDVVGHRHEDDSIFKFFWTFFDGLPFCPIELLQIVKLIFSTFPWPLDVHASFPDKDLSLSGHVFFLSPTQVLCHAAKVDLTRRVNCHSIVETFRMSCF